MNNQAASQSVPTKRRRSRRRRSARATVQYASSLRASALEGIALVAITVLLILGTLLTNGAYSASPALSHIEVQAGDTLWTLAQAHPVDGLTTAQVADLVAESNALEGAFIAQGQDLLVPAPPGDRKLAAR